MKFGVRECCDVVLRAKGTQKVGNKIFYKNEPVIYFDTLKTSSLEGAATTVYAQGGRGNARLMSWDGERTLTWTMEDALISPVGIMILTGAGLIDSPAKDSAERGIIVHTTEQIELNANNFSSVTTGVVGAQYYQIKVSEDPYDPDNGTEKQYSGDYIYVMRLDENGDIVSEPFIGTKTAKNTIQIIARERKDENQNIWKYDFLVDETNGLARNTKGLAIGDVVLVDYYREVKGLGAAQEINITPDKFGGSYYLEASTLFRNEDGSDMPAEFIIPNCRIQSNFTFTLASSGDPSSFTFTMDCFPDYTRWNKTEKVLATIQVITEGTGAGNELMRLETNHHGNYVYTDIDGVVHDMRYTAGANGGDEGSYVSETEGQLNGYGAYHIADNESGGPAVGFDSSKRPINENSEVIGGN